MKKRGFTLIELLSVILILAIISVIATPIILNVIEDSRKSAAKISANGVVDAARYHYYEHMANNTFDGENNEYSNILPNIQGQKPENDEPYVYINNEGEIAIAVVYNGLCFIKQFNTTLQDGIKSDECKLDTTVQAISNYAIVNFYDWDNTFLGSTMVPKGDGRSVVNEYVLTHFIHPELQTNKNYSSTARVDNYRGQYPSISPTEGNTVEDGDKYRLTNGLDYVFYGKDKDSDYPYVNGWVEVDQENMKDTWTNIGRDLTEDGILPYSFKNVQDDLITVKAIYKPGMDLKLGSYSYAYSDIYYRLPSPYNYQIIFQYNRIQDGYGIERIISPFVEVTTIYNQDKSYSYGFYPKNQDNLEVILDFRLQNDTDATAVSKLSIDTLLRVNRDGKTFASGSLSSHKIVFTLDSFQEAVINTYREVYTKKYYNQIELQDVNNLVSLNTAKISKLRIGSPAALMTTTTRTDFRNFLSTVVSSALDQGAIDKYGNADVDIYQMQYALLHEGAYVSKEEAKTWCDSNCTWLNS